MRHGSIPSQWFGWANSWEPSLLLDARERLMKAGIKPEEASESQVQAAVGVAKTMRANTTKSRQRRQRKDAMPTPKEQTWEIIDSRDLCGDTCRLKVPGGWLYRERESTNRDGYVNAVALAFVPMKEDEHD